MRFTRPLLDRRTFTACLFFVAPIASGLAAASCGSSDERTAGEDTTDAAVSEASPPSDRDGAPDVVAKDAAPFEGGVRPVVCEGSPCATSLVTTLGAYQTDRAEGFCVLLSDKTVACWGAGSAGQLGRGAETSTEDSATATRVEGVTDVVSLDHTCALDSQGDTYCWGTGPFLQTASATSKVVTPVKLPIPKAKKVAMTFQTACAVVDTGVLCWGLNSAGQIAPYDGGSYYVPLPPTSIALPSGAPIRDLVVGSASFVLRDDGSTVSWGANPPLARPSPLFPDPYPQPIDLGGIANMDVALDDACAVAGGVGYCWGSVNAGLSYDPRSRTDRALPEAIVTAEPIVQIATTAVVRYADFGTEIEQPQRWCACGASGDVWCQGYNASGQAGDGTKDFAFEPVKVQGLPAPAAQVKTTPDATCALLTTGKVYCWGSDFYGQLGTGKYKASSLVPTEVVLP